MEPGLYKGKITDLTPLEDRIMAGLLLDGTVMTKISFSAARQLGKSVQYMIIDDFMRYVPNKGARSLRNRHHKAKPQPNHGPRKLNQW